MTLTSVLDKSAIGLSVLCLLHWLALPLALVTSFSFSALWVADESFHQLLVFLVLPTSFLALALGCKKHRTWVVPAWGMCGITLLIIAALFGHDWVGEIGEKLLTFIGSILVMVGHVLNFRLCRSNACSH